MGDLERVLDALQQADVAGNKEDAMKLASLARSMEAHKTNLGMAPFANKAIAETLGAPVDLLTKGLNYIPGVNISDPVGGTKSVKKAMVFLGDKLPPEGREATTYTEHIGRGVGEVMAVFAPMLKGAQYLSKGKSLASGIADTVYKSMLKHPYLGATSEITGGVGTGVGRATGEQSFPDNPTAQSLLEISGGITGGMSPSLALYAPTAVTLRGGKFILSKVSLPFSEKGAAYRAGEFVKGKVADPSKTIKAIDSETISKLPPAVIAGEKRLTSLYKSFVGQDPTTDAETIETLSKAIVTLEKEMRKLGYGSPELLAEITQKRIASLELTMDRRVLTAMGDAQKKLDALPVAQRKVAESRIVSNEIERIRSQEYAKTQKLWQDVPKDLEIAPETTLAAYKKLLTDTPEAQLEDIPTVLKNSSIINIAEDAPLQITNVKEMQGLRSKLLERGRIARKDGQWNKARIADDMSDAILTDMGIVAKNATTPEATALQTALASTKQYKIRFEQGTIGKILGYGKSGAPAIDPDLTLDISIGRMGQRGSVDIEKIAITPDAISATKRYLARSFTDYATDVKTGQINPLKAGKWIKNNEAILDKFPDLQKQLGNVGTAQDFANKTRITMEARKKVLRDPKISSSARYLNFAQMDMGVDSILKARNPAHMANEMVRQASKDASGDAVKGLRGGFVEYLLDKSAVGGFNDIGEQTLSGRTLLNVIRKEESVLKQIFTPDQIARTKRIGAELAAIESYDKTSVGKPDIEMKDFASNALRLFSRFGGATFGRWLGKFTGGGTVQVPGMMSDRFHHFATHLSKDRAFQMVSDAILSEDATLLKTLLSPLEKPTTKGTEKSLRLLGERMNVWLAGTGKRVFDDIQAEIQEDQKAGKAPQ